MVTGQLQFGYGGSETGRRNFEKCAGQWLRRSCVPNLDSGREGRNGVCGCQRLIGVLVPTVGRYFVTDVLDMLISTI